MDHSFIKMHVYKFISSADIFLDIFEIYTNDKLSSV